MSRFSHETSRQDWENLLNELFDLVVNSWKNGLAVISNTTQKGMEDPTGTVTINLCYRLKEGLDPVLKQVISQFNRSEFERIFILGSKNKPDLSDCYSLKNLGLPNNTLVYLITQANSKSGERKKALLAFAGPCIKKDLEQKLLKATEIIGSSERIREIAPAASIPPALKPTQLRKVKPAQIKDRLNYLESKDVLNSMEQKEKQALEDFLMHMFKTSVNK
ncbi:MAG: hypothetical protein HQM11_06805 [SAR324 cluster bacterium]|nr:hypothetical protein [SAR324 cluster bacterium]